MLAHKLRWMSVICISYYLSDKAAVFTQKGCRFLSSMAFFARNSFKRAGVNSVRVI
jgi:hypothetical protein